MDGFRTAKNSNKKQKTKQERARGIYIYVPLPLTSVHTQKGLPVMPHVLVGNVAILLFFLEEKIKKWALFMKGVCVYMEIIGISYLCNGWRVFLCIGSFALLVDHLSLSLLLLDLMKCSDILINHPQQQEGHQVHTFWLHTITYELIHLNHKQQHCG